MFLRFYFAFWVVFLNLKSYYLKKTSVCFKQNISFFKILRLFPNPFCDSGTIFWLHFGSILGPFWGHFGFILGTRFDHISGSILGTIRGVFFGAPLFSKTDVLLK